MNRVQLETRAAAILEMENRKKAERNKRKTIYGIQCPKKGLVKCLQKINGKFKEIQGVIEPDIFVPLKMEKFLTTKKRFKVVIGGRGSGKSFTAGDVALGLAKDDGMKFGCFRQFQSSIKDSIYSLLKDEVDRLGFDNFNVLKNTIEKENGAYFAFEGLERNVESVKSKQGFHRFLIDEAQTVSEEAFRVLTPTLRTKDSEVWLLGNPRSSADAFSQRFIVPFQEELTKNGYYEDDLHLIIVCNYMDNPFFPDVLEQERQFDYENLPRSLYDHIWLGHHNDNVEDAIILPEWFDAAIDMHKSEKFKVAMEPLGAIISSHDASDKGGDDKAYACRHASIIRKILTKSDGEVSDGATWATGLAIKDDCDVFTFDGAGMGSGIRREISKTFEGKKVIVDEHLGAATPDDANKYYDFIERRNKRTNKEVFKNKRAQYMWRLRDRFLNTYKAVIKGEYVDPELLISLDSEGIENMEKLRSEVCRQPLKDNANGLIQMMSKKEMKKIGIPSPNMLDALAMTMIFPKELQKKNKRKNRKLKIGKISMA